MKRILVGCVLVTFASLMVFTGAARSAGAEEQAAIPAGTYELDKSHASLIFRVSHLGFSMYTARFTKFDAELFFDPENPQAARVTAKVDPTSLETDFPVEEMDHDFNAQLLGPDWLDADQFPEISFVSKEIEPTGGNSAKIIGDFTLHGVTKPLTLNATYNGGYERHEYDPDNSRIGFSATGSLKRSEYGIANGIPAPGSDFGVGDEVDIILEVEFSRPHDSKAD